MSPIADASILEHKTVAIGGGARGVNLHIGSREVIDHLHAEVADVSITD